MPGSSSFSLTNCRAAFELTSCMSHILHSILFVYILHIMWVCALHDFIINICESKLQLIEKMQCEQKRLDKRHSPSHVYVVCSRLA